MTDAMDTVKTEDIPPLDENSITDEEKDASCDVEVERPGKPEGKMCEIREGKREKKVVQRLNMLMSKPKEKLKIGSTGKGVKLGDIARVNHSIGKLKAPLLKPLHKIAYDRPGAASSLRKNLRLFNGFTFEVDSDPYNKKLSKMARLPKTQLKTICQTLDLERSGKQSILVDRIMTFLLCPTDSGKPVMKKKKRKTTKDVKREKSLSKSKKPQKKVESGKSRAIVTDSSSEDDDDEDEEEKKEKNKSTEKSATASQKRKNSESQSSDKGEDEEEDEEEEENDAIEEDSEEEEKKSPAKKATKKPEQKSDESTTDDSDQCSQEDEIVKKTTKKPAAKRKAPAKPVPKTKKADSSSNRRKKTASKSKDESESSDDDQPLIKMIKKPPTDDQLKATIQDLLKDANLEVVTMKQLCRQVYDKYPDFDLTSRKDFIKDTVKSVIS